MCHETPLKSWIWHDTNYREINHPESEGWESDYLQVMELTYVLTMTRVEPQQRT